MIKKKLIRVTTADISLNGLLKGQLKFLNQYYEVVGVAADTGILQNVAEREGIRVIDIPMHREISLAQDFRSLMMLYRLFRREKPYIVHANTPKGSLLAMIAAKMARIPNRLYTVTGLRYQGAAGLFRTLLMTMERISCYYATKVIPEGQGVKSALLSDKITSKPMQIIHNGNINGVDTNFFSIDAVVQKIKDEMCLAADMDKVAVRKTFRESLGLKDEDFAFIFIGRIVKDKGMTELAEAMRRMKKDFPQCKLVLVGRFESQLDPLNKEDEDFFNQDKCVKFVGYQKDVRPYLFAADALVFPSYREGFPNVVLQAGSMGLPAIVTDINGCNEIIEEGMNGCIVPSKDVDALYGQMKWVATHLSELKNMADRARSMIKEQYEQGDVWNALLKTYKGL